MYYYELCVIKLKLKKLIYHSKEEIKLYSLVKIKLRNKIKEAYVVNQCEKPDFKTLDIIETSEKFLSKKYFEFANFISSYYLCELSLVLALFTPFSKKKNYQVEVKTNIKLSLEQNKAYKFIKEKNTSLLFADTGAGKTEIYMKLFEDTINEGKNVLYLMPEISLTPQMGIRLKEKFKDYVGIWHSKITKKAKEELLEKLKEDKIKILAGTRSALFSPLNNIGLIVVDEEDDSSYKSNENPRYHARDMAIYLAKSLNAKILLGSASPSLNSYVKHPFFRLKQSYYKSKRDFIFLDNFEDLNPKIIDEINKTISNKKQVLLFVPIRGNFKYIICKSCKKYFTCPFCEVSMSLHSLENALKCHYCNYACINPKKCDQCQSTELMTIKIGTKQIKEYFLENKKIKVALFDRDNVATLKKLNKLIKDFNDKKIDLLIGTQMLAKGHDYKNITLSVILGIDGILNLNDFKAREKTLSLFLQVAGRSGRSLDSKVLVQTNNKEFFQKYLEDYELFLKDEIKFRKKNLYPPFSKMARLIYKSKNLQKAEENMKKDLRKLEPINNIEIIGYGACTIAKIASNYRFNILIRANKSVELIKALSLCSNCIVDNDVIDFS